MTPEIEGNWDIVITSLQDICNSNESLTFDNIYNRTPDELKQLSKEDLNKLEEEIIDHKSNIGTAKRLITTSSENITKLIEIITRETKAKQAAQKQTPTKKKPNADTKRIEKRNSSKSKQTKKVGRSYWTSKYNPLEPIYIGLEVADKIGRASCRERV